MKTNGGILVVCLAGAPLAQAQPSPGGVNAASTPPSSATFSPTPAETPPSGQTPPAPTAGRSPNIWAENDSSESGPSEPRPSEPQTASNGYVSGPQKVQAAADGDDPDDAIPKRGAHRHDGFYLRLGLGPGYISAKTQNGSTIEGWGVAPDIWLGGTPAPGLAIGVTFNGVSAPNPHAELTAADTGGLGALSGDLQGNLTYSVFGLFGDYYPDPTGGLHFMAGVNYSVLKFAAASGAESTPASGVGLLGGVGYEWWVGRDWSIGPLARLHWASVNDDVDTTRVLAPVLLLGMTYH